MQNDMRDRLIEEPNYCDYCFNFDKEHIGMDGTAVCKLTNKIVYSEDGGDCPFFNVPKERIIVPPCKVDDIVYAIGDKDGHQIKECRVVDFGFADAERFQVTVYFECDQDCDGCYFNDWSQSYCGEWGCSGEYGNGLISIADFGKTVFLTKSEAEQKLKEMRGE